MLLKVSSLSSNIGFGFYLGSGLSNLKGSITRKSKKKETITAENIQHVTEMLKILK